MSFFKIPLTALSDCLVLRSVFRLTNNVHYPITVHTISLYTVRSLDAARLDGSVRFGTRYQGFDPRVANEIFSPERASRPTVDHHETARSVITPVVVRLRHCVLCRILGVQEDVQPRVISYAMFAVQKCTDKNTNIYIDNKGEENNTNRFSAIRSYTAAGHRSGTVKKTTLTIRLKSNTIQTEHVIYSKSSCVQTSLYSLITSLT